MEITYCDGKSCGTGKKIPKSPNFICEHNNLAVTHPHLANEWDPDNEKPMSSYTYKSSVIVKWICSAENCGCHKWEAQIRHRAQMGLGCLYCSNRKLCEHNNLLARNSGICEEWHEKNEKGPETYTPGSDKKVWWKCSKGECECHEWEAAICDRTGSKALGCPYCSNRKLCPHNNLEARHSELVEEWSPNNKKKMSEYSPGSDCIVEWKCKNNSLCDCHVWKTRVYERTGPKASGCPYCVNQKLCNHNNLEACHTELIPEWHPDNKPMKSYSPHTASRVKWRCEKGHIWESTIGSRTGKDKTGCPCCSGRVSSDSNNLEVSNPELIPEYHPENISPMNSFTPHSGAKVLWVCQSNPLCGCHVWEASVNERTGEDKTGCPYCSGHKVCEHSNLKTRRPYLEIEWHPDNKKLMTEYSEFSSAVVMWKCSKSECNCHVWETSIVNRTKRGDACPYCRNQKLCDHNNLEIRFPALLKEWHPDNIKPMKEYPPGSGYKAIWICPDKPDHTYKTRIYSRTGKRKTGCPHCCISNGYSKAQIKWLTQIEQEENINIQHARKPEREFYIKGVGLVDGYCAETNTVFEYEGKFFHSSPALINHNRYEINPLTKKTFGEMYDKTIAKNEKIKKLGFNLIVKWED